MSDILVVEDLRKNFGGIAAVDGATFSIEKGSITGLIGPNGAGKTTTFNLITGFHRPDSGSIEFNGEEITGLKPHEISLKGLSRTFQITRELKGMTVLENLMLAPQRQRGENLLNVWLRRDVKSQEMEVRERSEEMLEFLELDHLADELAGNLSGGQRKLLELGRVLMTDPDLILLDEPVAGVNPTLMNKLLDRIRNLRDQGYTFCIVEHDIEVIMELSDTVIVMTQGKKLMEGSPEEVRNDERVIEAYLGG
ncbi:MAG: ABC transporter ATP-binding protein [Halobacteria archaeon]|nr:ABC transporter ATP-binding protein [Halobacteria archaeon]